MEYRDLVEYSDQFADVYDGMALDCEFFAGDCIFGMMYEYIGPGQRLLDLGIGTGLGSVLFAGLGMEVHGLDASEVMLAKCREKGFAEELRVHDLSEPLPYGEGEFDHAISVGVLHFLEDVDPLFGEVARVTGPGGVFGFTTVVPEDESRYVTGKEVAGFTIFQHGKEYIGQTLARHGFELVKTSRFIYYPDPSVRTDIVDRIHIARKKES